MSNNTPLKVLDISAQKDKNEEVMKEFELKDKPSKNGVFDSSKSNNRKMIDLDLDKEQDIDELENSL